MHIVFHNDKPIASSPPRGNAKPKAPARASPARPLCMPDITGAVGQAPPDGLPGPASFPTLRNIANPIAANYMQPILNHLPSVSGKPPAIL